MSRVPDVSRSLGGSLRPCGGSVAARAKRTPPERGSGRRFTMVRSMWRSRWRTRDRPALRPGQLQCPRCRPRMQPWRRWPQATRAPLGPGRSRGPSPPSPAIPRKAWCSARALVSGQDRGLPSGSPVWRSTHCPSASTRACRRPVCARPCAARLASRHRWQAWARAAWRGRGVRARGAWRRRWPRTVPRMLRPHYAQIGVPNGDRSTFGCQRLPDE